MRAFDFAARQHWAIQTEVMEDGTVESPHLKRILDIALRTNELDFEAVAQKLADRADDTGLLEMHGSIAVLNVIGPIMRYANLFTMISGATSVQEMATAFRTAVDDPAVKAIILNIDSPGGEVAGISELAQAIYGARDRKPIVAYADGLAASGAYWLASAAGRLVASDTAELGSIGVVATIVDRAPREGVTSYQFVSSISPKKRPDLATDDGRATVQQRIDDLAGVFVSAVARNRGVNEAKVLADFGQGGVMIAAKAVAAGMADEIGTFDGVVAQLSASSNVAISFGGFAAKSKGEPFMDVKTAEQWAAEIEAAKLKAKAEGRTEGLAEGRTAERTRVGAILASAEAKGREQLARTLALDTDTDPEVAKKLLAAAAVQTETKSNPLAGAMDHVPNPRVGAGAGTSENDDQAEIAAILAAGKLVRGGK